MIIVKKYIFDENKLEMSICKMFSVWYNYSLQSICELWVSMRLIYQTY